MRVRVPPVVIFNHLLELQGVLFLLLSAHMVWQFLSLFLELHGVGGVTVSMVAFQAVDPGSTPGRRIESFKILP